MMYIFCSYLNIHDECWKRYGEKFSINKVTVLQNEILYVNGYSKNVKHNLSLSKCSEIVILIINSIPMSINNA